MMERIRFRKLRCLLAAGAALTLAGIATAATEQAAARFEHYISRRGDRLYDGDREFRFIGANLPGLMLPYDFTLRLPERMAMPTAWEQEDAFKTLVQMNFRVVRTWNLPIRAPDEAAQPWHYVLGPDQFNEEAFKVTDRLFALANRYGVRVIFSLTADAGDYLGGVGTYAAHRGKSRAEFFTDPQLREDYKATVRHVLNRINTVTGVRYGDDKAVLAWQFGNEMDHAPDAWHAEMGAYIKSLAPHQLVADTRHRPENPMYVDANIDLVTRHLYTSYGGGEDGWPGLLRRQVASLADKRPLMVGEYGPYIGGKLFSAENLMERMHEFFAYTHDEPMIAGSMVWSMYFHREGGGFYWHQVFTFPSVWSYHWPGFPSASAQQEIPLLRAMREAAFRLEGKPAPPLPVPEPPELLPFTGVPLFSWRGSAGASGYDIERAAQPAGPWTTLAANVSDADVAYRPLFSDTTARTGQTWFYRVRARNESGVSAPSNVVGPVAVERVCVFDELQDLSRGVAHSEGLQLNNTYNALYAEYLFRAKGAASDWIAYELPAALTEARITAFFDATQPVADFVFETSANGKDFTPMAAARHERRLAGTPGGAGAGQRRIQVDYTALPIGAGKYLRVRWQGPAELDRVEMYHTAQQ